MTSMADNSTKRLFIIVLDSFGVGALPDADAYGDAGSNTLLSISHSTNFSVPFLQNLGLFNLDGVTCGTPMPAPRAAFGRLAEQSAGKDTTVGHWEIAGLITKEKMPTYPDGFPADLMAQLSQWAGRPVLCGLPYSGTQVLTDYGREHLATGGLIVYTSADSVLQVAAHEELVPLAELYRLCEIFRTHMQGQHGVGRVIARPFVGAYPNYTRTENRHDYALPPPATTMLDKLSCQRFDVIGVGKIYDIFAGQGLTRTIPTKNNQDGMARTLALAEEDFHGLCFVNLVDFDMLYGHRNDVDGYAAALTAFDRWLPTFCQTLKPGDAVFITADHGCDPATPSTDHSREYTPLLAFGDGIRSGVSLGTRPSMADIAATVQDYFGLPVATAGESFWPQIRL